MLKLYYNGEIVIKTELEQNMNFCFEGYQQKCVKLKWKTSLIV